MLIYQIWERSNKKVEKYSVSKKIWPFNVRINCSSDLQNFANARPSPSNFQTGTIFISQTIGQNNFQNKIPTDTREFDLKEQVIDMKLSCSKQIWKIIATKYHFLPIANVGPVFVNFLTGWLGKSFGSTNIAMVH